MAPSQHSASHNDVGSTPVKTRPFTTPRWQEIYLYMLQTLSITEMSNTLVLGDIQGPPQDQSPRVPANMPQCQREKKAPAWGWSHACCIVPSPTSSTQSGFPKQRFSPPCPGKNREGPFVPQEVPELKRIYILSKVLSSQETSWSWKHQAEHFQP